VRAREAAAVFAIRLERCVMSCRYGPCADRSACVYRIRVCMCVRVSTSAREFVCVRVCVRKYVCMCMYMWRNVSREGGVWVRNASN